MILVTGSTGTIGQEVVARLSARRVPFRAFVRDAAKGARLFGPGVELAQGDLDDGGAVARALAGVDTVFLLTAANPAQELGLIEQAVRAGVRRVVKLSSLGASLDSDISLARGHAQVEARLKASPLAWTILRPGMFAQNLLHDAGSIRAEHRFVGAYGEGRVAPIDARDIAEVAVAVLTQGGHDGHTYALTGPELLTYRDLAARLSTAVGSPIAYVNVPIEGLREGMKKAVAAGRLPAWLAEDLVKMQAALAQDTQGSLSDDVSRVLGHAARSFDEFARDHAAAFRG